MNNLDVPPENNLVFTLKGNVEMLRITPSGFFVRGQLINQDDNEAEIVYNAFKEWLAQSILTS
jgi:hypothetical protein